MRIVHIGLDHRADDVRIAYKECVSLAEKYEVIYITLKHDKTKIIAAEHLSIVELPYEKSNCSRFRNPLKYLLTAKKQDNAILNAIYDRAVKEDADVYHIHEYSLLKVGLELKKKTSAKIIYDIHEDYPRQLENSTIGKRKPFILIKKLESFFAEKKENRIAKKYDYLICATPHIRDRFDKINRCEVVCNYPIINKAAKIPQYDSKSTSVCYIGTIFRARGITELVQAIDKTDVNLLIAGNIRPDYEKELKKENGWKKVDWLGFLDREGVEKAMTRSLAGMVTLLPCGNIVNSLPVKMFEYMLCGIPVITSDFPLFRNIVQSNNCGICVNPSNIDEIASAIEFISKHKEKAKEMGLNGYAAVIHKYNWNIEKEKLLEVYNTLL